MVVVRFHPGVPKKRRDDMTEHVCDRFPGRDREACLNDAPEGFSIEECEVLDEALEQAMVDLNGTARDFARSIAGVYRVEDVQPPEVKSLPRSERTRFMYDEVDLLLDIVRLRDLAKLLKGRGR